MLQVYDIYQSRPVLKKTLAIIRPNSVPHPTAQELFVKAEAIQNLMMDAVTGGLNDEDAYRSLRDELLKIPRLRDKLPPFVQKCRSLSAFWTFIKPKFGKYLHRRQFLWDEFEPALKMLETEARGTNDDESVSEAIAKLDSEHVAAAWRKARDRRVEDPEGAITSARTLLEAVCKHILDDYQIAYDDKDDLPKLYGMTAERLSLSPSQHTEQIFKQILGGCKSVVEGLGALRNKLSDAHGKGKKSVKPLPRHADLAVNLAGSMATFIVSTWEAKSTLGKTPK